MSAPDGSAYPSPLQLTNRRGGTLHKSSRSMGAISESGLIIFGNNAGDTAGHGAQRSLGSPEFRSAGVLGGNGGGTSVASSTGHPLPVHQYPNALHGMGGGGDAVAAPVFRNSTSLPIPRVPHSGNGSLAGNGGGDGANNASYTFSHPSWEEGGLNRTSKPIQRPAASIPLRRDNGGKESTFLASGACSAQSDFFGLPEPMMGSVSHILGNSTYKGQSVAGIGNNGNSMSSFRPLSDPRVSGQTNDEGGGMNSESGATETPHSLRGYHPPLPNQSRSQLGGVNESFYSGNLQGNAGVARGTDMIPQPAAGVGRGYASPPPSFGHSPSPGTSGPRVAVNTRNPNMGSAIPQPRPEHFSSAASSSFPAATGVMDPNATAFLSAPASTPSEKGVPPPLAGSSGGGVGSVVMNSLKRFIWTSAFGNQPSGQTGGTLPLYQTRFGCPEDDLPLLEELGVDIHKIIPKAVSVLNFFSEPDEGLSSCHDLAGPIVFAVAIALLLLLQGKVEFSAVYALMVTGVILLRVILPLMSGAPTSMVLVTSALGYGLLPCVFLAMLYAVQFWFLGRGNSNSFLLPFAGLVVLWAAWGASSFISSDLKLKHQHYLIFYPCALFYALFAALTII